MKKASTQKLTAATLTLGLASSLSGSPAHASKAPGFSVLGSGSEVRGQLTELPESDNLRASEVYGKGGEGKCGEGKCGEKDGGEGKCGEGKCGEKDGGEGKCGEGKCGEKDSGEGKCGEGKCGEK